MYEIVFYDFWDKNPKRRPLAIVRSINEIQVIKNKTDSLSTGELENQIILLNGLKYRIIHVDKKLEENSIAKHHLTNNEITYDVLVEAIND